MTRQVALFAAGNPETGSELWITDGTPGGTRLLRQLLPGPDSSAPSDFTDLGDGRTLFVATDGDAGNGIWVTDGTPAGTVLVAKLNPDGDAVPLLFGPAVHALGDGRAVFTGTDGTFGGVWVTDGTAAGTVPLLDAVVSPFAFSGPTGYATLGGGLVLFSADDGVTGEELWVTDGTPDGTSLVADLAPGADSSSPGFITPMGDGTALFIAADPAGGLVLHVTDGTGTAALVSGVDPALVALGGGLALFTVTDGTGTTPWLTDGTAAGTAPVTGLDLAGLEGPSITLGSGRALLLGLAPDGTRGVWATDGTASGTVRLALPEPVTASFAAMADGRALFTVDDGAGHAALWVSDGSLDGTALLRGLDGVTEGLTPLGTGRFVFAARAGADGPAPWVTDGTAAGTMPLHGAGALPAIGFVAATFADLPVVSAAGAGGTEGSAGTASLTFTLTRTGDAGAPLTLDYAVAGAGARPADAADFAGGALPSGTATFAAGSATATITLGLAGDAVFEPDETFTLSLASPDAGLSFTFGAASATGTILNDDAAVSVAAALAERDEGASGSTAFTFTVTRTGNVAGALSLAYAVSGTGAAPASASDFAGATSGTVAFAAGETARTVTVAVRGDRAYEPDEGFTLSLSAPSAPVTFLTQSAEGTIRNDDALPRLTITATDADKAEAAGAAGGYRFTVTRAANTSGDVSVRYAVAGSGSNPATAADFLGGVFPTGTLLLASGSVTPLDIYLAGADDAARQSDRTFSVTLLPTPDAEIAAGTAFGTIRDDDAPLPLPDPVSPDPGTTNPGGTDPGSAGGVSTVSIAALDANRAEGDAGTTPFTFTLTRAGDLGTAGSVAYAVSGAGSAPAPAYLFAGGAYPSGTAAFAPGQAGVVLTVLVAGNVWEAADAGFQVVLASPAGNVVLGTAAAVGIVRNDDAYQAAPGSGVFQDTGGNQRFVGVGGSDVVRVAAGARGASVSLAPNGDAYLAHAGQLDLLRGIEAVQFIDGRLVFDPADPAAQTARLYQAGLGRLPDQAGLGYWAGAIQRGASLGQLAASFLGSPEFAARFGQGLGDAAFVSRLYLNVLGRAPDPGGQAYWTGRLGQGAARADVLAAMSESAENRQTTAGLVQSGLWHLDPAAAQAARMYDTVLGRMPDLGGLAHWTGALGSGALGLANMADAFVASPEFQAVYGALSNRDFVAAVYGNTLHRAPDAGGLDYWTAQLDGGGSRAAIVVGFSESAEHVGLTAANILGSTPGGYGIALA